VTLEKMKKLNWIVPTDMWEGKTVWILGGGPSLSRQFNVPDKIIKGMEQGELPISVLSPYMKSIHNEIVIGINMAFRIGDWIDMVFWGDPGFYRKPRVETDLIRFPGKKLACHQSFANPKRKAEGIETIARDSKRRGISDNPETVCWNGNSGAAAISVAVNAGAKRIILVGFDMSVVSSHSHWHNEYGHPKVPPFKTHIQGFKEIAEDAQKRGVEIINASPNSTITFFPKASVADVLEGKLITPIVMDTDFERGQGAMNKYQTLQAIHRIVNPDLYLEIGVGRGNSLKRATAKKIVAVDPKPRLRQGFKNAKIYKQTPNEFFKQDQLHQTVGLAFIDGLHLIENVLQDFINVEKHCKQDSIVVLDDVAPAHPIQGQRTKQSIKWAGDVWKIVPILKQYRPDLDIKMIDTNPTGMLIVANLDPANTVLQKNYQTIVKEWKASQMPDDVMLREGVYKDLDFLQNNNQPLKVAVLTPTANPDRKPFLDFLQKRIAKQTRQPDKWLKVDYENTNGQIDLSNRYKQGISQLLEEGFGLIIFMEDDDYYPTTYVEEMVNEWVAYGKPSLLGVRGTTYYYLKYNEYKKFPNPSHCSAFCTAVSSGVSYLDCPDNIRSFDLYLWQANQMGSKVEFITPPIGIKHGVGMNGRNYHQTRKNTKPMTTDFSKWVDDEAFVFYEQMKQLL